MTFPKMMLAGACLCMSALPLAAQTGLNSTDKQFMTMAAQADMTEAHLGQMAQAQGTDADFKNFGQTLTQDHTKAYEELSVLSGKTGESIPKGIDVGKDAAIRQMTKMKGRSFESTFLRHEIQDHERVLAAFKHEAAHGQNADVKSYAQKMLPTVEEHLHEAQKLAKSEGHA